MKIEITKERIEELRPYPISYRIQKLRWWSDLTQEEFGKLFGVKQPTVGMWESGANIPRGQVLEQMKVVFDLPSDFFEDAEIVRLKLRSKKEKAESENEDDR